MILTSLWPTCLLAAIFAISPCPLSAIASGAESSGSGKPTESLRIVNRQKINPTNVIHVPRPNPGTKNVPLRTSFFVMVGSDEDNADPVKPDSVSIHLQAEGAETNLIVDRGQAVAEGYSCRLFQTDDNRYGPALAIFVKSETDLEPQTQYQITVTAESDRGARLREAEGSWSFTTENPLGEQTLGWTLDLTQPPDVQWQGEFFSGLAKSAFCTSSRSRLPHYDRISVAQQEFPHAWNLQRDAYLAGFEHQPNPFKDYPNIVRERETRRITAIHREKDFVLLQVEDFFGHQQYGIPSNRSLSEDYHKEDEILIADGISSARAHVIEADDTRKTVKVTNFTDPDEGWKIEYTRPLPTAERPHAPGFFPPGGTYLRKFNPVGTPHYYWGRVDHEWDIVHGQYGRRVIPRFADAMGCLSIDGRSGTTAKNLVQLHEVTRTIAGYLIDRYGDAALQWPWVILNEPDLWSIYWRCRDWEELQRFYDYSSDAILRAFEDRGYDSSEVRVGGLELGAIWGTRHLQLDEFLIHCSPHVEGEGALVENAAIADPRLDNKRSRRVEQLCSENGGRGAPLDFLSVHTYNASHTAAAKLIASKQRALEIDPDYYQTLRIVSHETVPTWRRILDPDAAGIYLGNGYFTSWMADYQNRLLQQAAVDSRYAYGGDLILMHWPGVVRNFMSLNDTVREIQLDNRSEIIAKPSHHFVNLLSTLRRNFYLLPLEQIGGHAVSGFATLADNELRIVVYSHHHEDTASLSEREFEIELSLFGLSWNHVRCIEYQFDRNNNSYFNHAQSHRTREGLERNRVYSQEDFDRVQQLASLQVTADREFFQDADQSISVSLSVSGNGANFVIVKPKD